MKWPGTTVGVEWDRCFGWFRAQPDLTAPRTRRTEMRITESEMRKHYHVHHFIPAPWWHDHLPLTNPNRREFVRVKVTRKADGCLGSLTFTDRPRLYYNFQQGDD